MGKFIWETFGPITFCPWWGPLLYGTGTGAKDMDCWHFPCFLSSPERMSKHISTLLWVYIINPEVWSGSKLQFWWWLGRSGFERALWWLWNRLLWSAWSPQRQQCAAELTCCSCVRAPLGESLSPLLVSPQLPFPKEKKRRSRSREEGRRHYRKADRIGRFQRRYRFAKRAGHGGFVRRRALHLKGNGTECAKERTVVWRARPAQRYYVGTTMDRIIIAKATW